MAEMALRAYHRQYGLKCVPCRLHTIYGERENETHAVIALIAKAFVEMDPYEVWGTGEQDRNFTYVGDVVDGMIRAAERIEDGTPVNIGTAEHIRIKDAVELIFEMTGFKPKRVHFDSTKPVGIYSRAADLTQVRRLLEWEPITPFREGLRHTIDWYYTTKDRQGVASQLDALLVDR
jgi:UDP-glucose 4-epimerase